MLLVGCQLLRLDPRPQDGSEILEMRSNHLFDVGVSAAFASTKTRRDVIDLTKQPPRAFLNAVADIAPTTAPAFVQEDTDKAHCIFKNG